MRRLGAAASLAGILIASCDDPVPGPPDCTPRGGVCKGYTTDARGLRDSFGPHYGTLCAQEIQDTRQCGSSDARNEHVCCILNRCNGGRGYCRYGCAEWSIVAVEDPDCPDEGDWKGGPCCMTLDGR
jgi:hypothetical protein